MRTMQCVALIKMGEGHTHTQTMTNPIELINLTLIVCCAWIVNSSTSLLFLGARRKKINKLLNIKKGINP